MHSFEREREREKEERLSFRVVHEQKIKNTLRGESERCGKIDSEPDKRKGRKGGARRSKGRKKIENLSNNNNKHKRIERQK